MSFMVHILRTRYVTDSMGLRTSVFIDQERKIYIFWMHTLTRTQKQGGGAAARAAARTAARTAARAAARAAAGPSEHFLALFDLILLKSCTVLIRHVIEFLQILEI